MPEFLYGDSKIVKENDYYDDFLGCFLGELNSLGLMVSDRDIETAELIELHLNKDIYFSNQTHADRFMKWLTNFNYIKTSSNNTQLKIQESKTQIQNKEDIKNTKYDYAQIQNKDTGFWLQNKSMRLTVYDKRKKEREDSNLFEEAEDDDEELIAVRLELQFKNKKLASLPFSYLKITNERPLMGLLIKNQHRLDMLWKYFMEDKLLFLPKVYSKASLRKEIERIGLEGNGKSGHSVWLKYLESLPQKGLSEFATEHKWVLSKIRTTYKKEKICFIYLRMHTLKNIIENN